VLKTRLRSDAARPPTEAPFDFESASRDVAAAVPDGSATTTEEYELK
jgi:hypothetical protein